MVGISDRLRESGATAGMETALEGRRADGGHNGFQGMGQKREKTCLK